MKKILSVLAIIFLSLTGFVFAGCNNNKNEIKIDVYYHLSNSQDEEYEKFVSTENIEFVYDATEQSYIDIRVYVTKNKENLSAQSFVLNNSSDSISITNITYGETYSTARIVINGGGSCQLKITSLEGGNFVVPIDVVVPVTEITNTTYQPAVVVGDSITFDSNKLFVFKPNTSTLRTTQKSVKYELVEENDEVTITDNVMQVSSDYVLTANSKQIEVKAISVVNGIENSDVYTTFNVQVVENFNNYALIVNYFDLNTNTINSSINIDTLRLIAKNSTYDSAYVRVSVAPSTLYTIDNTSQLQITYLIDKASTATVTKVAGYQDVFLIRGNQTDIANVTFNVSYKTFKFTNNVPSLTKTISVNVRELPTNLYISNNDLDGQIYFVYDEYIGSNGLELKFEATPYNVKAADKLIYITINGAVDNIKNNILSFKKNGVEMTYDASQGGFVINSGDTVVIKVRENATFGAEDISLTARVRTTPTSFNGNNNIEAQYISKNILLRPRKMFTDVSLLQSSTFLSCENKTTLIAKDTSITSTFYLDFNKTNVDLTNIAVSVSGDGILLKTSDNVIKDNLTFTDLGSVLSGLTYKYSFGIVGTKVGNYTLTISSINGFSKEYNLQVINAEKNPTVTYLLDDNSKSYVGYYAVQNNDTTQMAVTLGNTAIMRLNSASTMNSLTIADRDETLYNLTATDRSSVNAQIIDNRIYFTALKEGTSVYTVTATAYKVSDLPATKGVIDVSLLTYSFEVAVYTPVKNFSLSKNVINDVYIADSVGVLLQEDNSTASVKVNYNSTTATQKIYFSNSEQNCFEINVNWNLGSSGYYQTTGVQNGVLTSSTNTFTIRKNQGTTSTLEVRTYVTQFGKNTSNTVVCRITFKEATKVDDVSITSADVSRIENTYTMNLSGQEGTFYNGSTSLASYISNPSNYFKTFSASATNSDASFDDLTYQIYNINGNQTELSVNNDIISVYHDASSNLFYVVPKKGGSVILKIVAKDSFISEIFGTTGTSIYITVSDGVLYPYYITNATQFLNIANNMSAKYVLTNDIDLINKTGYPLGNGATFTGELNGDMTIKVLTTYQNEFGEYASRLEDIVIHSNINNLTLSSFKLLLDGYYLGLFAKNEGTISNLNFVNAKLINFNIGSTTTSLTGSAYVGFVAGQNSGTIQNTTVSIQNSNINVFTGLSSNVLSVNVGIVAGRNDGTISSSQKISSGKLSINVTSSYQNNLFECRLGGIAGLNNGEIVGGYSLDQNEQLSILNIEDVVTSAVDLSVTTTNNFVDQKSKVGGIVGENNGNIHNVSITNTNGGSISGGKYVGGIVGYNYNGAISESLVVGAKIVGTKVEMVETPYTQYIGGAIGYSIFDDTPILLYKIGVHFIDVFNTNTEDDSFVSGKDNVGGLIGYAQNTALKYCFIENFVSNNTNLVINNNGNIAGLIADAKDTNIYNSFANANMKVNIDIASDTDSEKATLGGLVAQTDNVGAKDTYYKGRIVIKQYAGESLPYFNTKYEGFSLDEITLQNVYCVMDVYDIDDAYIEEMRYINNQIDLYTDTQLKTISTYPNVDNNGFRFATIGDEERVWAINGDVNDGYPILILQGDVEEELITIVPSSLNIKVNEEYFAQGNAGEGKGKYYSDEIGIIYYYNRIANNSDNAQDLALNSYKLVSDDDSEGLIDIGIVPSLANGNYIAHIVTGEHLAYISNGNLILKSAGTKNSNKITIEIYAVYNNSLEATVSFYVTNGYVDWGLYSSNLLTENYKLANNKQLVLLAESSKQLLPFITNGEYAVNSQMQLLFTYLTGTYLVERSGESDLPLFELDGEQLQLYDSLNEFEGLFTNTTNSIDLKTYNYDTDAVHGYLSAKVRVALIFNLNSLSDDFSDEFYEFGYAEFYVIVKKQATQIDASTQSLEMNAGGQENLTVNLQTNFVNNDIELDETSVDYLFDSNDITNKLQDELRLSMNANITNAENITAINNLMEANNVDNIQDLFDIFVFATKIGNNISYNLTLSLKNDTFNNRYLENSIVIDLKFGCLSNRTLNKTITLTINPEELTKIITSHYPNGESSFVDNNTRTYVVTEEKSNTIIPGTPGILKINLEPYYSYVDYVTITSSSMADGTKVIFEQMLYVEGVENISESHYVSMYPRPEVIDNGLKLYKYSNIEDDTKLYNGILYVRTNLPTLVATSEIFDITITGYKHTESGDVVVKSSTTSLLTKYNANIIVNVPDGESVLIDDETNYLVQTNSASQKITVEVFGYELTGEPAITTDISNVRLDLDSVVLTNRNSVIYTYVLNVGNLTDNTQFNVTFTLNMYVNNVVQSRVQTCKFVALNLMIDSATLSNLNSNNELSMVIGSSTPLKLIWNTFADLNATEKSALSNIINQKLFSDLGIDFEDSDLNISDMSAYLDLFKALTSNSYGQTQYKSFTEYNTDTSLFQTKIFNLYEEDVLVDKYVKLIAQASTNGTTVNFSVGASYIVENGNVSLKFVTTNEQFRINFSFTMKFTPSTTEDNPLPIYTQEGLENMVAGQNYILMNDLTLYDWQPLEIVTDDENSLEGISSLDGNNKILKIINFVPKTLDESNNALTNANVGLFAQVSSNTLLKNITIDISELVDVDLTSFTTYNFGVLAGVNNGLIVNCEIINRKSTNTQLAVLSQEILSGTNVNGIVGGLVGSNSGNITNSRVGTKQFQVISYSEDGTSANTRTLTNYKFTFVAKNVVGGFVGNNTGIISSSYVANMGVENIHSKPQNTKTAGFVATNSGRIHYSYVKGDEMSTSSTNVRAGGVLVYSTGNAAGFVYNNTGNINDCYTNIMVDTDASIVAGFVYTNSGNIIRTYTTAYVGSNSEYKAPFVGVDKQSNYLDTGDISDSYFLQLNTDNFTLNGGSAIARSLSNFLNINTLNGFTLLENNQSDGIWAYGLDNYAGSDLLPDLVSAKDISHSVRYIIDEQNIGEDNFEYSYSYVSGYEYGSDNNPYIIRNAKEFNSVLTDGMEEDSLHIFDSNVRFVDDIDLSAEIKTSKNVSFEGKLDGNGMSISNITVNVTVTTDEYDSSIGLFSKVNNAVIKNLTLKFNQMYGTNVTYSGGLAGIINDSKIMNINLEGNVLVNANNVAGGLAGLINGESHIENISSDLGASVGYSSENIENKKVTKTIGLTNIEFMYSNEYMDEETFDRYKSKLPSSSSDSLFANETDTYAQYVRTLSYAGGLAGIIDISLSDSDKEEKFGKVYSTNINVKQIKINSSELSSDSLNTVKIMSDNSGGIVGYVGIGTYLNRTTFLLSSNANANNQTQFIKGLYSAGGIAGQNYGRITMSQIVYDTEAQYAYDTDFAEYILNTSTTTASTNKIIIQSEHYAGGFVGINFGGIIENSLTKAAVYTTDVYYGQTDSRPAYIIGGFVGANIEGIYNSVYTASLTKVSSTAYTGGFIGESVNVNYSSTSFTNSDGFYLGTIYLAKMENCGRILATYKYKNYIALNKVVVVNNYVKTELTDTNATHFGVIIGYNGVENSKYIGSQYDLNTEPDRVFYSDMSYVSGYTSKLVGNANIGVNDLGNRNLNSFKSQELYNLDFVGQPDVFEELFDGWSTLIWTLRADYYLPLLLKFEYQNYFEIWNEEDFNLINLYPDANFVIKQNITMTKVYNNNVVNTVFTGTIIGETAEGVTPTVKVNIQAIGANADKFGFFRQSSGARFTNIIFDLSTTLSTTDLPSSNITGGVLAHDENGSILNYITLKSSGGTLKSLGMYTGGLVGLGKNTMITNCVSTIPIKVSTLAQVEDVNMYVGGIAGYIENVDSESLIRSCYYASSQVDSTATDILVADYNTIYDYTGTTTYDYTSTNVGGIIGGYSNGTLSNSVKAKKYRIEVVADNDTANVGGLVGVVKNHSLLRSNNVLTEIIVRGKTLSDVSSTNVGGMVGYVESGSFDQENIVFDGTSIIAKNYSDTATTNVGGFKNINAGGFAGFILDSSANEDEVGISQAYSYADLTNIYNVTLGSTTYSKYGVINNGNFGGLIGQLSNAKIDSCLAYNNITLKNISSAKIGMIGSVIGSDVLVDIQNTLTAGLSRINNTTGNSYLSGLVGQAVTTGSSNILVENVATTNRLLAEGTYSNLNMGGMFGYANGNTSIDISNSYSIAMLDKSNLNELALPSAYINALIGLANGIVEVDENVYYSSEMSFCTDANIGKNIFTNDLLLGEDEEDDIERYIPKVFVSEDNSTNPWTKNNENDTTIRTLPYPKTLQSEVINGQNSKLLLAQGNVLNPKLISNNATLNTINQIDESQLSNNIAVYPYYKYYLLVNDIIDANTTVASGNFVLNGLFIGGGHTIQFALAATPSLFDVVLDNSAVTNLKINLGNQRQISLINTRPDFGTLTDFNYGTLFMCNVDGTNVSLNSTGGSTTRFGGLVSANFGNVFACSSTIEIISASGTNINIISGMVARNGVTLGTENIMKIKDTYYPCIDYTYYTGYIANIDTNRAGIIGVNDDKSYIKNSYSAGIVVGGKSFVANTNNFNGKNNYYDFYANLVNEDIDTKLVSASTKELFASDEDTTQWTNVRNVSGNTFTILNYGYRIFNTKLLSDFTDETSVVLYGLNTGSGTQGNPVLISNIGVLDSIRDLTSAYQDINNDWIPVYFKQIYDINLAGVTDKYANGIITRWYGIGGNVSATTYRFGTDKTTFYGNYYSGNRASLSGSESIKTINGLTHSGVFNQVDTNERYNVNAPVCGKIFNLNVSNISNIVTGGAIVNTMLGGAISNCTVSGTISDYTNSEYLGGFVGKATNVDIYDCYVGDDLILNSSESDYLGGFVGEIDGNTNILNNSVSTTNNNIIFNFKNTCASVGGFVGYIGEDYAHIQYNEDIAFAFNGNSNIANTLGGIVGIVDTTSGKTIISDNSVVLSNINADVIGAIVGKCKSADVYSNELVGTSYVEGVSVLGGVIGIMDDANTTIGRYYNDTYYSNTVSVNFVVNTVKSSAILRGFGGVAGVMKDGTVVKHDFGNTNQIITLSNTLLNSTNISKVNNVGGVIGYMESGSLKNIQVSNKIEVKGYKNIGGFIGFYNGTQRFGKTSITDDIPDIIKATIEGSAETAQEFASVIGVKNVGGIFGRYEINYTEDLSYGYGVEVDEEMLRELYSLNNLENKNTVSAFSSSIPNTVYSNFGGIVGYVAQIANISECYNYASVGLSENSDIGNSDTSYAVFVGGITGKIGSLIEEPNTDTILTTGDGNADFEVIYGLESTANITASIYNCYNYGNVTGLMFVGGIMGYSGINFVAPSGLNNDTYLQNGYVGELPVGVTDNNIISGEDYVGGIVGYMTGDIRSYNNDTYKLTINNNGTVQSDICAGGIVGYATGKIETLNIADNSASSTANIINNGIVKTITDYKDEDFSYLTDLSSLNYNDIKGFGGIVGQTQNNICGAKNEASVIGIKNVGGIVGNITIAGDVGTILNLEQLYNVSTLTQGVENVGGLVGYTCVENNAGGSIELKYSSSNTAVEGLSMKIDSTVIGGYGNKNIGGIIGQIDGEGAYAVSYISTNVAQSIEGALNVGGIVGLITNINLNNIFTNITNNSEINIDEYGLEPDYSEFDGTTFVEYDDVNIFSAESFGIGGFVGKMTAYNNSIDLKTSLHLGNVNNVADINASQNTNVGGIFGLLQVVGHTTYLTTLDLSPSAGATTSSINVNNSGYISGKENVGGIFGYIKDTTQNVDNDDNTDRAPSNIVTLTISNDVNESLLSIGGTTAIIEGETSVGGIVGKSVINSIQGAGNTTSIIHNNSVVYGVGNCSNIGGIVGKFEGSLNSINPLASPYMDNITNLYFASNIDFDEGSEETTLKFTACGGIVGYLQDATLENISTRISNITKSNVLISTPILEMNEITETWEETESNYNTFKNGFGGIIGKLKLTEKYNYSRLYNSESGEVEYIAGGVSGTDIELKNISTTFENSPVDVNTPRYYIIDSIENQNYTDGFLVNNTDDAGSRIFLAVSANGNELSTLLCYTNNDLISIKDISDNTIELNGNVRYIYRYIDNSMIISNDDKDYSRAIVVYNDALKNFNGLENTPFLYFQDADDDYNYGDVETNPLKFNADDTNIIKSYNTFVHKMNKAVFPMMGSTTAGVLSLVVLGATPAGWVGAAVAVGAAVYMGIDALTDPGLLVTSGIFSTAPSAITMENGIGTAYADTENYGKFEDYVATYTNELKSEKYSTVLALNQVEIDYDYWSYYSTEMDALLNSLQAGEYYNQSSFGFSKVSDTTGYNESSIKNIKYELYSEEPDQSIPTYISKQDLETIPDGIYYIPGTSSDDWAIEYESSWWKPYSVEPELYSTYNDKTIIDVVQDSASGYWYVLLGENIGTTEPSRTNNNVWEFNNYIKKYSELAQSYVYYFYSDNDDLVSNYYQVHYAKSSISPDCYINSYALLNGLDPTIRKNSDDYATLDASQQATFDSIIFANGYSKIYYKEDPIHENLYTYSATSGDGYDKWFILENGAELILNRFIKLPTQSTFESDEETLDEYKQRNIYNTYSGYELYSKYYYKTLKFYNLNTLLFEDIEPDNISRLFYNFGITKNGFIKLTETLSYIHENPLLKA